MSNEHTCPLCGQPTAEQPAVLNLAKYNLGDWIAGSWQDPPTGKTYAAEGVIKSFPAGVFVESEGGGITPINLFFYIREHKLKGTWEPQTSQS